MKDLSHRAPWLIGLAVTTAFLLYGFWPQAVRVEIATVQVGSLEVTVDDDGETRIREKYIVSAPVSGQLLRVQLHPGDEVAQSQTELASILPADPALLDARTQIEAEAKVKASEAAEELANASFASATELAELAQHQYDRAKQLIRTKAISQEEFDTIEHQAGVAKANVRVAEFGSKVKRFERELASAALLRTQNKNGEVDASAIKIIAPTSGCVLRVFHEDAGVVNVGAQLLEIGDVQNLEIVLDVLSTQATRIHSGDRISIDQWGGENQLIAKVRYVEPSAFLKISALGVDEKRVNVIADFVSPLEDRKELGDGFRVEARITVETSTDHSFKLPSGAFFRHQEAWHVYRIRNEKAELVAVKTGLTNGLETEVLSGLAQGDIVILYPTDAIRPGVRVIY